MVSRWVYGVPEDADPIACSDMVKPCCNSLWDQMHGFISQGNQDVLQVLGSCPHMELCNWESTWSWKDLRYPHSGTGTLIQCCWGLHWSLCKLVHRSRRLGGWTGFWPNGKCFHKSSVKYCWKSPLCHFEKYWCLFFFFFFFSGNFH